MEIIKKCSLFENFKLLGKRKKNMKQYRTQNDSNIFYWLKKLTFYIEKDTCTKYINLKEENILQCTLRNPLKKRFDIWDVIHNIEKEK